MATIQNRKQYTMTPERIKEIHSLTAYPESISVRQALLQVWNECEQDNKELRGEVRKLREGLEEMISTIERNAVDNRATIENVKLWAKSWREELLTETEG
jgi:DNA-binding winged helix-turn-helix (wHTH) protein